MKLMRESSHIRVLVFSSSTIQRVSATLDENLTLECQKVPQESEGKKLRTN